MFAPLCKWLVAGWLLAPRPAVASVDLGLWEAVLATGDARPGAAVDRADAVWGLLHAIGGEIVVDEPSMALMRRVRDAAIKLNLRKLYGMLPEASGDVHRVRAMGTPGVGHYEITYYPTGDASAEVGAFDALVSMQPSGHEHGPGDAFVIDGHGSLATGELNHTDIARGLEALLRWAEGVARAEPQADIEEALWDAVERSMPSAVGVFERFVVVERIGRLTDDRLRVDLSARVALDRMKVTHPHIARYLRRMGNLVEVNVVLLDHTGSELGEFSLSSDATRATLRFDTAGGAFWPLDGTERPVRPTDSRVPMRLSTSLESRMDGVRLSVADYPMPVRYVTSPGQAQLTLEVVSSPEVDLGGTGALTGWLVQIADNMLNLEEHAMWLFDAVADGPGSSGSRVDITWDAGEAGRLVGDAQVELVDNGLIRFAMRIVGWHLVPSDEVVSEALGLMSEGIAALEKDYRRVRPALVR